MLLFSVSICCHCFGPRETSEYLLKHGLLDLIVPRPLLKQALAELLLLYKEAPLKRRGQISYGVKKGLYPDFETKLRQEWRKNLFLASLYSLLTLTIAGLISLS